MNLDNAFLRLYRRAMDASTRPYLARGMSVTRCQRCRLGLSVCICSWRKCCQTKLDVMLILHRDEIFKPTNTGRLIADVLPDNTFAFEWSRQEPDATLIKMLTDPQRICVVLFPADQQSVAVHRPSSAIPAGKTLTLIVLDGTWKQARKMFRASDWLKHLPILDIGEQLGQYRIRQAVREGQLATAEAAAVALGLCGEALAEKILTHYFDVFQSHYMATRMNCVAPDTEAHRILSEL